MNNAEAGWFRRVAASHLTTDGRAQRVIADAYDLLGGPRALRNHIEEDPPTVEIVSIERTPPEEEGAA
ncbi:MAG TPA: hypothetical protein VIK95_14825 [Egibacteraceae bacterium]